MKCNARFTGVVGAIVAALVMTTYLRAQPNAQEGWSNKQIQGDWSAAEDQWSGPLIADLDGDGAKEVIVADNRRIRVFDTDGDEIQLQHSIEIPDDNPDLWDLGYRIRGIPAVGDVNGDGYLEIVYTIGRDSSYTIQAQHGQPQYGGHLHDVDITAAVTSLFVCDGGTGAVIAQTGCIGKDFGVVQDQQRWVQAWTPVLADVDVLTYNPSYPYSEDGRMEIILGGWGHKRETQQLVQDAPNGWHQPDGEEWALFVILLNDQDELEARASASAGLSGGGPGAEKDYYILPAVGDMNRDGRKEIVLSSRDFIWIRTYDPSDNSLTVTHAANITRGDFPNVSDQRFCGLGPILADVDNDGNLWAIVPHYNGSEGDPATKVFVVAIDGTQNEHWDGSDPENEMLSGRPSDRWNDLLLHETPAVFDNLDNGYPDLVYHTLTAADAGRIYSRALHDGSDNANWYKGQDDILAGAIPAAGLLHYSNEDPVIYVGRNANGGDLQAFDNQQGDQPVFSWGMTGNADYSVPAIVDLDNDGDYEVALQAFDGNDMRINIWSLGDQYEGNEHIRAEWSQLQNGPRHSGLYAQPYSGELPDGWTFWRDRVIITGWIEAYNYGQGLCVEDGAVVEFNPDCGLVLWSSDPWGKNVVIKPNYDDPINPYYLGILCRVGDPFGVGHFVQDGRFLNVNWEIEDSISVTFENCYFDGGSSSSPAISTSNGQVTLTNCTFTNYSTAVSLTNCTGSISHCTFENNDANAIEIYNTAPLIFAIDTCTIQNNGGSGIYLYNASPTITKCDITGNSCAVTGSAIYCYNSSPTLKNNDIHGNAYNGIRAASGGTPVLSNGGSTYYRNRFQNNNTATHTPRSGNTWAEMIRYFPSSFSMNVGHNDIINTNGGNGDYLISAIYGSPILTATNNYWVTVGTLSPDDFSPTSSVTYLPKDNNANYIASDDPEYDAEMLFYTAIAARDSGNFAGAYDICESVLEDYRTTGAALLAIRQIYECASGAEVGKGTVEQYFAELAKGDGELGIYADRLATLCMVDLADFDNAIQHYEEVLAEAEGIDSLYWAIDLANAELQQAIANKGDQGDSRGDRKAVTAEKQRTVTSLMALLNGMPDPTRGGGLTPNDISIITVRPNPFNGATTVDYFLPNAADVSLEVYDSNGRLVTDLINGQAVAGRHSAVCNAAGMPSGTYLVKLSGGGSAVTAKTVLVR